MWKTLQILKNVCMIAFYSPTFSHNKVKSRKEYRITSTHVNPLQGDKFLSTEKNIVEFLLCLVAAEFCAYAFHMG